MLALRVYRKGRQSAWKLVLCVCGELRQKLILCVCVCVCVCSEERQSACTNYNCVLRGETECLHKWCGQYLVRFSKK